MRTRFDNNMVAHVWAQQSQEHGQSNNGQFYFDGPTIYSYGGHFPIATFHNAKGGRCVLFTTRGYSHTTSAHKHRARRAIPSGVPIFYVKDPVHPLAAKDDFESRIRSCVECALAAKKKGAEYLLSAHSAAQEANEFAAFFGYRWRLKGPDISPEQLSEARKAKAEAEARKVKKAERAEVKRRKDWLAGLPVTGRGFDAECGGAALRIVGDELQTSHGARVPLEHAIRAFRFVKLCREQGRDWQRNGHSLRVGHFAIDSVDAQGNFKAGCHELKWQEVERVARLAGVFDQGSSDDALEPSHVAA